MKFGYVKTALCSPRIKVADVKNNVNAIIDNIEIVKAQGAELIVFPELSLTGCTCQSLFLSDVLLDGVLEGICKILQSTKETNALIFLGAPIKKDNRIYNCAIAIYNGEILGIVPQTFVKQDVFASAPKEIETIEILDREVPFGNKLIFSDKTNKTFTVGVEIGEDMLSPICPANTHALAGANIIVNLSGFYETVGAFDKRIDFIKGHTERLVCGYALCNAGLGESTTDCVYAGQKIIAEKGKILESSGTFEDKPIICEIDTDFINNERTKLFKDINLVYEYQYITFNGTNNSQNLVRKYKKMPFVPTSVIDIKTRAESILTMQAQGLKKRVEHTNASSLVLGLSGGLDSTLAILVAVKAIKMLNRLAKDVVAITMPCFGTTSRTFQNSFQLAKALGVTIKKVDITKAVQRHLKDIKHQEGVFDVTFENAQARERTQVLMDVANMNNGLVIGTGDLSELALGWATYNGDHMSMYGVNCSIPKTLVRYIVEHCASNSKGKLKAVLLDILDTPVSPELLPVENDTIAQKTEDIVGPYILHDFFLYNMLRKGYSPKKLYYVACQTFKGDFKEQTILKWLKIFVRRFFNQQFKRSCLPDGVKVGSVSLSPRGEFKMPSDANSTLWLNELENI
ncbi:MAG: NAD(+) synthase [Clostridia bacterium]|nr:NAD(+) synthase [Clostridia bacterium]